MRELCLSAILVLAGCGEVTLAAPDAGDDDDDDVVADASEPDAAPSCETMAVGATTPAANATNVPRAEPWVVAFTCDPDSGTVNRSTLAVHGMHGALQPGYALTGRDVTITVENGVPPGELITITATDAITSAGGVPALPRVWQLTADVTASAGRFLDAQPMPDDQGARDIAFADVNGDGAPDVVAGSPAGLMVFTNDGSGAFNALGAFGAEPVFGFALGDLDGDGDLDAFTGSDQMAPKRVLVNNGSGAFSDTGQSVGVPNFVLGIGLGDLDGDGDLDAYVCNTEDPQSDEVFLNEGDGTFVNTNQELDTGFGLEPSLGDIDGDGDLDAIIASDIMSPNTIRLNDGTGQFTAAAEQPFGMLDSVMIALGDVDGDLDLDAVVTVYNGDNALYLNDGGGSFTASDTVFGPQQTRDAKLVDTDGDGDLDIFFTNVSQDHRLFLNDGTGTFTDSGQLIPGGGFNLRSDLADIDGDGDLDLVIADQEAGGTMVMRNQ